jgi:DNA-binding XRE family transcriptional regulator
MKKREFAEIRRHLGKTQNQMAQILGVSAKAVQSFEQGWRGIPVHIERQILLVLALKRHASREDEPCWLKRDCPEERKQDCPAWQFDAGHLCWFINGTICEGSPQGSWQKKMKICRECEVYHSILPASSSETTGRTIRASSRTPRGKGAGNSPTRPGKGPGSRRKKPV